MLDHATRKCSLVGLGGVLERAEDVRVRTTLDAVDKARDLREEWIVVSVDVSLLVVISGASTCPSEAVWEFTCRADSPDKQCRGLVRIDESHVVTICPDFKFTCVGVALEGNGVGERADSTVCVFPIKSSAKPEGLVGRFDPPNGTGNTRNSELLWDLALVNGDVGELSWWFVEFDGTGTAAIISSFLTRPGLLTSQS